MGGATAASLPRTIWYMGAKARVIPGFLDRVLWRLLRPGQSVLDLFSGTGIVSAFCARRQRVISNDVQEYAWVIARSLLERPRGGGRAFAAGLDIDRDLLPAYRRNRRALDEAHRRALEIEGRLLAGYAASPRRGAARTLAARYREFLRDYLSAPPPVGEGALLRCRRDPARRPACLITAYYANVYHGLRQAIDLDSLRAAIEELDGPDPDRKRVHYLSALIHAASVTTSGTSHFAQPRQLTKDSELLAMARRRQLDVLAVFRGWSEEIARSVAAAALHPRNLCLCEDYRGLIRENGKGPELIPEAKADVVYMDPPYTADNYSRFYHLLETLARYDYPELERDARGRPTAGRYPAIETRFQSRFCQAGRVEEEFAAVIGAAAGSGAGLVISYGSPNGLLLKVYRREHPRRDPVRRLRDLCRVRYREVEVFRRPLMHSGQGDSNIATEELLVVCERPR